MILMCLILWHNVMKEVVRVESNHINNGFIKYFKRSYSSSSSRWDRVIRFCFFFFFFFFRRFDEGDSDFFFVRALNLMAPRLQGGGAGFSSSLKRFFDRISLKKEAAALELLPDVISSTFERSYFLYFPDVSISTLLNIDFRKFLGFLTLPPLDVF